MRDMTWGEALAGLLFASCVGVAAIAIQRYDLAKPEPHHYVIDCLDATGKVVYHDESSWAPSVYRNSRFTCIIKGVGEPSRISPDPYSIPANL